MATFLGGVRGYGRQASLASIDWPAGCRAQPSVTSAEQMFYLISGQLKAFVILQDGRRFALTIRPGGFLRIPALAVSWLSNEQSTSATLVQFCGPSLREEDGLPVAPGLAAPWETEEQAPGAWRFEVDPKRYDVLALEAEHRSSAGDCGLLRDGDDVEEYTIDRGFAVSLRTKMLYGVNGSIMAATRPPGYHSTPHLHDCEQLNVVSEGDLWGFMISPDGVGHAYFLPEGSLWRVPALAVHWAWNRGDIPVTLIEYHTPGLQQDPVVGRSAMSLLLDSEVRWFNPPPVSNLFVTVDQDHIRSTEELPAMSY